MPSRRRNSTRIAMQAAELAVAVPQVMAHRLARLTLAGASPSARDRNELQRMGAEKVAAFYESWHAMILALFRANLSLTMSPFRFWWSSGRARRTTLAALSAGLAPVQRRASANARRLRRTRVV